MKTTLLGGFLFLVPVAFVAIVLGKTYQISMMIADPVGEVLPIRTVAGVAFVNLLAIILLVAVCFGAGMLARRGWASRRMERLDGFLIDIMPGYAVAKGMIGSVAQHEDLADLLTPVVVRFVDHERIAFEIERNADQVAVFLPGSPSSWSGTTAIVGVDQVRVLDVPVHQAVKTMRVLGRGSLAAKA